MSIALAKGQNTALSEPSLQVRVDVPAKLELCALLLSTTDRVRAHTDLVCAASPVVDGVTWCAPTASEPSRLTVELGALPVDVARVLAVATFEAAPHGFTVPPTARVYAGTGAELYSFTMTGLRDERALIAWEFYRRDGRWKLRAVGQGYGGGLAELAQAHGTTAPVTQAVKSRTLSGPRTTADTAAVTRPPDSGPAFGFSAAAPGPPAGATPAWPGPIAGAAVPADAEAEERLYDQSWSIYEDAARSTAAYKSATGYAARRRDDELSALLADPATRNSPDTHARRATVESRHDDLVRRAEADYRRDIGQLLGEAREMRSSLPPSMAQWDSRAWRNWNPPTRTALAIRVGDLYTDNAPDLLLPMMVRLPLGTPLWIDSGSGNRDAARTAARALIIRLLASYPPGGLNVHVCDLVGAGAAVQSLQPLAGSAAGVVVGDSASNPRQLAELLDTLVGRVDLIRMATSADALDTLAMRETSAQHVLVLHDFPYGLDERAVRQIQYLMEIGPLVGVGVIVVADPADVIGTSLPAASMWQAFLRLSSVPDNYIGDPWVGLRWTYVPDAAGDVGAMQKVLARLAAG